MTSQRLQPKLYKTHRNQWICLCPQATSGYQTWAWPFTYRRDRPSKDGWGRSGTWVSQPESTTRLRGDVLLSVHFLLVSSSTGGGEKRALHVQPRLVVAGLPAVRDDRGPVALSAEEEEDQEGGGGEAGEGGGGGIFQQVLRGGPVPLQDGGWTLWKTSPPGLSGILMSLLIGSIVLTSCSSWPKTPRQGWVAWATEPRRSKPTPFSDPSTSNVWRPACWRRPSSLT